MAGRASAAPAAASSIASGRSAPVLPAPLEHHYVSKHGGSLADAHVFVKYAVRYKGAGEVVASKAWPLAGATPADSLEAQPVDIAEAELTTQAPTGIRYGDLPEWLGHDGARLLEKALRERLPDKLATTVQYDPVTKMTSAPGESAAAFAARLGALGGGAQAEKLRARLDKKRRDLDVQQQDLSARSKEKWFAVGSAILSNIGLLTGRRKTISGAGTVMSKNRLENTAEARVEALEQEIAALDRELAEFASVDAARFEARPLVPAKGDVKLLRFDLAWVH
jgi:hypothetical protein